MLKPAAREHDLVGQMNPRCLRCHRTLIEIIAHPAPCRRVPVKAPLVPLLVRARRRWRA